MKKQSESQYASMGVDAGKENVRASFATVVDNEYPGAFVNIVTDPFDPQRAMTQHQDGDGSKFVQRLLDYYENKNADIFEGMVDDAVSMNTGDIAASGFVFMPWLISDVLNLNLPKEVKSVVMQAAAHRFKTLLSLYKEHGFQIKFTGGETADLKDQVLSGVFDVCVTAWAEKKNLIAGNVRPGDMIFGWQSDGQASWENKINSGLMSNGLTMARTILMHSDYNQKYPSLKGFNLYRGKYRPNDYQPSLLGMSVGEALTSPTRQWAIAIKKLLEILQTKNALHFLHGIVMNTGGGATKIKHLGIGGIAYRKIMQTPPPIFCLIKSESGESWRNMYQTFNCGIGVDIIGEPDKVFIEAVEEASKICQLKSIILGSCTNSLNPRNEVILRTPYGEFDY
jgi:phosphoribosylformylglycinamidine cyclo-ligase